MFDDARAVLFDLDGTLIDSAPDLGAAADKMRTDRGLPSLPLANYRPMAGAGARGMIGVAFGYGADHPDYEALKQEFLANYEACMTERTRAFDGVAELLDALVQLGLDWGVVTNKVERFALPLTQHMTLFASARAVVGGDTTPHAKPHPAPCSKPRAGWTCLRRTASMWGTMSATSWPVMPLACAPWPPATATLDSRATRSVGAHAHIDTPLELLKWLPRP